MSTPTTNSTALSWHQSLEQWCTEQFGTHRQPVEGRTEFAPYEAHRPDRYHGLPVVLVVLSSTTRAFHGNFAEALDLIRMSTNGFRVILATDVYDSDALHRTEWAAEQILSEQVWLARNRGNWLQAAGDQVIAAQQYFGADYVVAPTNADHARELLVSLTKAYNAQRPVRAEALRIFDDAVAASAQPSVGFRGDWESIEGSVKREFSFGDDAAVSAQLSRTSDRGLLIDAQQLLTEPMLAAAHAAGWNTAVLAAVSGNTESTRDAESLLRGVALAAAETLDGSGPAVLVAGSGSALDAADSHGVLRSSDSEQPWALELPGVAEVRFAASGTERVLAEVGRLYGRLFS